MTNITYYYYYYYYCFSNITIIITNIVSMTIINHYHYTRNSYVFGH